MNEALFRMICKMAVKEARNITDDQEALEVKDLYKQFEKQIGKEVQVGEYIQYSDKLYRVLQTHTISAEWTPDVSQSLFIVIDKEHEGTLEDPIPAVANMEYFNGKYYIEDDVLYLCIRDSEIALQYLPSALIGIYFELVNEEENKTPTDTEELDNGEESVDEEENTDVIEEPVDDNNDNEEVTEVEEGTIDNPIDVTNAILPIVYELDKYYKENEVVYKCTRAETLYYLPSALIGTYFEKVE